MLAEGPSYGYLKGAILYPTGYTVNKPKTNIEADRTQAEPWTEYWRVAEESTDEPSHGCPEGAILYSRGDAVSKLKDLLITTTTGESK